MVIETPPGAGPAARWLAGLVVAGLPLVAIGVTYAWWRDRLPDPMPSHWGRDGRVDGVTPLAGLVGTLTAVAVAGAILAGAGLLVNRVRIRRWLIAVGAAAGALGGGIWLMLAGAALDARVAAESSALTWQVTALPVAMFALAGAAFAACPPPPPYPPAGGRPAPDLPRAELPAGPPAAFTERSYPTRLAYVIVALILAGAVALGVWATPWAALPLVLTAAVTLLLSTTRLAVDAGGLRAGFGLWGWPQVRVPLREIEAAEVTVLYPSEWGGWGYRIRGDGTRGLILRRGPGVRLALSAGRGFVASTRDPEAVAGLLNTLVDRSR